MLLATNKDIITIGVNSYWAQGLKPPPIFMIMGLAYMTSAPLLGQRKSSPQTESRSVQPLLYGSLVCSTDRHTDTQSMLHHDVVLCMAVATLRHLEAIASSLYDR